MSELKFTKEHEWIKINEGVAVIGISDFAQEQLGDIVSIELPKAGGVFGHLRSYQRRDYRGQRGVD